MIKGICKTYSRCGKNCDERFTNIKEDRMFMLLGEKTKTIYSPTSHSKRNRNPELDEVYKEIQSHKDRIKTAKSKQLSPVFLSQGRDDYYTSTLNHDKVPPCGYYNTENLGIKKCKSIPNFSKRPKNKAKTVDRQPDSPRDKEKSKFPIKGISFQRQLPRPELSSLAPYVSDSRFESVREYPDISTKSRKVVSPSFEKGKGHNLVMPECSNSRIYNPNKEITMVNSSNSALDFEKFPSRTANINNCVDIDYNRKTFKQIDKNTGYVDFGKITSRPVSDLPFFMTGPTSRCGLGLISDKTLESNGFTGSQYFMKTSDFDAKKDMAATQNIFQISKTEFGKSIFFDRD